MTRLEARAALVLAVVVSAVAAGDLVVMLAGPGRTVRLVWHGGALFVVVTALTLTVWSLWSARRPPGQRRRDGW